MSEFRERVKRYRTMREKTVKQLAEDVKQYMPASESLIKKIENDNGRTVTLTDVLVLTKVLDIPPIALIVDLDQPFEPCDIAPYQGMLNYRVFRLIGGQFGGQTAGDVARLGLRIMKVVELIGDTIDKLDRLQRRRLELDDKIMRSKTLAYQRRKPSGETYENFLVPPDQTFLDILSVEDQIADAWFMISINRDYLKGMGVNIPDTDPDELDEEDPFADIPDDDNDDGETPERISDPILRFIGPDYEQHVDAEAERTNRNGSLTIETLSNDRVAAPNVNDPRTTEQRDRIRDEIIEQDQIETHDLDTKARIEQLTGRARIRTARP